jgi:hypothetical protein
MVVLNAFEKPLNVNPHGLMVIGYPHLPMNPAQQ